MPREKYGSNAITRNSEFLSFAVVSSQPIDATSDTSSNGPTLPYDYTEQRQVPITIPEFQNKEECRERFVVRADYSP